MPPGDPGSPDAGTSRRRASVPEGERRVVSVFLSVTLLVVGVLGSFAAAYSWRNALRTEDQRSFDTTATGAAGTLNMALQRDADAMATTRTLIASDPATTNAEFSRFFATLDTVHRYPGSFAFAYIQAVTPAELPHFATVAEADPPFGLAPAGGFQLQPPGTRSQYCLMRLASIQLPVGAQVDVHSLLLLETQFAGFLDPGVDECTGPTAGALHQAASSGMLTVGSFAPMLQAVLRKDPSTGPVIIQVLGNLTPIEMLEPIYAPSPAAAPGQKPAAPQFLGWVGGIFDSDDLLAPIAGTQADMSYVLSNRLPDGHVQVLARYGTPKPGYVSHTYSLSAEGHWVLTLTGPLRGGPSPDEQGAIVLFVGLVLTALLFLLIRALANSRSVALALVEEKTGELRHLALHDPLTGLPNRTLILERTTEALERSRSSGDPVAVFFIDLDGFKDINDANGHGVGDLLLQAVAERFTAAVRTVDTVGRLGGDEFIVLAEGRSAARAEQLGERLLAACADPIHVAGLPEVSGPVATLPVAASIGIATGTRDSAEDLLRDADIALYQAKADGKGRFVIFEPAMRAAVRRRIDLEAQLREAVRDGQFFLEYQPLIDLRTMEVTGVEALLRWRHPTRGVVLPDEFVPSLEQSGLIVEAGRFVLEEACRQASAWQADGIVVKMSVNVSALQLESDQVVRDVQGSLDASGFEPSGLLIEITETGLMHDSEGAARRLRELKQLGLRVAIDDFGTGYSSLAYLQQFPADVLKIDGSFVTAMPSSTEATALVHAMVQLGRGLGLETFAEGIERPEELRLLRLEACNFGQGNLFAPAAGVAEVEPILRAGRVPDPST